MSKTSESTSLAKAKTVKKRVKKEVEKKPEILTFPDYTDFASAVYNTAMAQINEAKKKIDAIRVEADKLINEAHEKLVITTFPTESKESKFYSLKSKETKDAPAKRVRLMEIYLATSQKDGVTAIKSVVKIMPINMHGDPTRGSVNMDTDKFLDIYAVEQ